MKNMLSLHCSEFDMFRFKRERVKYNTSFDQLMVNNRFGFRQRLTVLTTEL